MSSIARRFHLRRAELVVLLGRFAHAGVVLNHDGRGGGYRFHLLRVPARSSALAL
ncbi:MAG TPA: hypothetical protein VKW76_13405 [Candidatus Binatia bacterium]|nr:hypothetical protein [Candidatus Binatia bacterium]